MTNEKATNVVQAAESQIGNPYVFGTWGSPCTPAIRKQYAGYNPQYKDKIYKTCPVLSDEQTTCDGCKWQGKLCFDCRGFTYWCLKQVGIVLSGGGATTQYDTKANWDKRGLISDMPDVVCCVFRDKNGTKEHTGLHIGNGDIDHCSGTVKRGKLSDGGWTHYAIPKGLYSAAELSNAGSVKIVATLKNGSTGAAVKALQTQLNALGYNCGTPDGSFGAKTEAAVRAFQTAKKLTVDGKAGPETQEALALAYAAIQPSSGSPAGDNQSDNVLMDAADFTALQAATAVFSSIINKYVKVG